MGRALGIADTKKRSPAPNAVLEAAFQLGPRQRDIKQLASHTGMSDRYCTVLYLLYCTVLYYVGQADQRLDADAEPVHQVSQQSNIAQLFLSAALFFFNFVIIHRDSPQYYILVPNCQKYLVD